MVRYVCGCPVSTTVTKNPNSYKVEYNRKVKVVKVPPSQVKSYRR